MRDLQGLIEANNERAIDMSIARRLETERKAQRLEARAHLAALQFCHERARGNERSAG